MQWRWRRTEDPEIRHLACSSRGPLEASSDPRLGHDPAFTSGYSRTCAVEDGADVYLSSVDEPRRHLLSEDPHLTQQVVQVLGLEPAERVLQARPPLPLQVLRYGVRASPEPPFHP